MGVHMIALRRVLARRNIQVCRMATAQRPSAVVKEQRFDYFLVLDFEATCDNAKRITPQVNQMGEKYEYYVYFLQPVEVILTSNLDMALLSYTEGIPNTARYLQLMMLFFRWPTRG